MRKWEYDISFHSLEDLGISEKDIDFPVKQVVACDTEGHCYFNDVMKLYVDVFKTALNYRGLKAGNCSNWSPTESPSRVSGNARLSNDSRKTYHQYLEKCSCLIHQAFPQSLINRATTEISAASFTVETLLFSSTDHLLESKRERQKA